MSSNKQIVSPQKIENSRIEIKTPLQSSDNLCVSFANFVFNAVCLRDKFNNHFKDDEHFRNVIYDFLQNILPKITSHKFSDICEGSSEGKVLHFHTIDEEHGEIVRQILYQLNFSKSKIDQIFEGHKLFEFSACLGHIYPARIIGYNVGNTMYLLFLDTNHHIYFNPKYAKNSLFYDSCPIYQKKECNFMPTDCFAVDYLDENKLAESMGYTK